MEINLKTIVIKLINIFSNPKPLSLIPMKKRLEYIYYQRFLGFNHEVPWPVHPSSIISGINNITFGKETYPGWSAGCYIQAANEIILGNNVRIGPNVGIISSNHVFDDYDKFIKGPPIVIGNNCWIGMNSVILPGVTIGDHVIIGAGSVVTKSFPSNVLIAGNPAIIIKKIDDYRN